MSIRQILSKFINYFKRLLVNYKEALKDNGKYGGFYSEAYMDQDEL